MLGLASSVGWENAVFGALVLQEPFFQAFSSRGGETADRAVGADDPVAGDYQWQWIGGQGVCDGPGGAGPAYSPGELGVSYCTARPYASAGGQYGPLECSKSVEVEPDPGCKMDGLAFEIGLYLLLKGGEEGRVALGTGEVFHQPGADLLGRRGRKPTSKQALHTSGKAEEAPFRAENCIFYRLLHPVGEIFAAKYDITGRIR